MSAALLLLALAAAPATVNVLVLTREHPVRLEVAGPRSVLVEINGAELLVDGRAAASLSLPEGAWRLTATGPSRSYHGSIEVRPAGTELAVVVRTPLEDYVAGVVAAETDPGTPAAALRAQAIAARSYMLGSGHRHGDVNACDLAHCQVLAGGGPAAHLARARRAARETAGLVLRAGTVILPTPFHAECAGHTADAGEIFGGETSAAVADPGCGRPWEAEFDRPTFDRILGEVLGAPATLEDVVPERGRGGYLIRVRDRSSGRFAAGDALVRALDASAGWGVVRSGHLTWEASGGRVRIRGRGIGHGVGLCQAGAARLAREGWDERRILARYFPGAQLGAR